MNQVQLCVNLTSSLNADFEGERALIYCVDKGQGYYRRPSPSLPQNVDSGKSEVIFASHPQATVASRAPPHVISNRHQIL